MDRPDPSSVSTAKPIRRPLVLTCVLLTVFMAAIEVTIVATAMPQIVARLGGFNLYSWVFAAVLLAQASTTVLFGKLADLHGRKPVLIGGISIFLTGSLLCGFAWSMPSLIVFRLIQGLGAGAMQPIAMTIIGDLYTPEERTSIQGYVASVWGTSAVIGPLTGGFIVQNWSWQWIFWMNIPVGLLTILGLNLFFHERVAHRAHRVDYFGALLVALSAVSLLLLLTLIGRPGTGAGVYIAVGALFAFALPALLLWERRAPEPIVAVGLWTHRSVAAANSATLSAGMVFIGITSFLPVYVQAVMDRSAVVAGMALTMLALGWPVATVIARPLYKRIGMRATARLGGTLILCGTLIFLGLSPATGVWVAVAGSLVTGFGMGFLMVTCVILVQGSVEWRDRGSATASNLFSRTLGNTLGAAVLGGALNIFLQHGGVAPDEIRQMLQISAGMSQPTHGMAAVEAALETGMHHTFYVLCALGTAAFLLALTLPKSELSELRGGLGREAPAGER